MPQARIVLDHFRLVMLANKMLTDVRNGSNMSSKADAG